MFTWSRTNGIRGDGASGEAEVVTHLVVDVLDGLVKVSGHGLFFGGVDGLLYNIDYKWRLIIAWERERERDKAESLTHPENAGT